MSNQFSLSDETTARLKRWAEERDNISRSASVDRIVNRLVTQELISEGVSDVREQQEELESLRQKAREFIEE